MTMTDTHETTPGPLGPLTPPVVDEPAAGTSLRELATEKAAGNEVRLPGYLTEVIVEGPEGMELLQARVTNRDLLAWEKVAPANKWTPQKDPFTFQTWLAWSAVLRSGQTTLRWPEFQAACLDVTDVKGEPARPTQ